MIMQCDFKGFW